MNDRILVTGGAGFIGSHLVELLCRQKRAVTVLDDLSTGRKSNLDGTTADFVAGSVTDPVVVQHAMRGVGKVVHLAALPSVSRSLEHPLDTHHACATGTLVVLQAARATGARVVYAGSSSAYGNQETLHKHEGLREDPLSPYAAAKLAGELYCRAFARSHGLPIVVARFFNVFGPRQTADSPYSGVVAAFSRALLLGKAVRIDGDGLQSRDFTYVEDVVAGVLQCLDATTTGCETVNLAYGQATTVRELYDRLRDLAAAGPWPGGSAPAMPDPIAASPRAGDVRHSLAANERAKQLFGFAPRIGFAEGLKRTFDWYRSQSGRSTHA